MDLNDIKLPEEILAEFGNPEKAPRGFPEQIKGGRLWNVRQHFVWLVETTWDEVGCNLPGVRTMTHLRVALKPWEKRQEQEEHAIKALLRSTEKPATSKLLRRQRKQQGELHERFLSANEWLGKCWDSLERFMRIPIIELSPAEQDVICDAIKNRSRTLARAGAECLELRNREEDMQELVE